MPNLNIFQLNCITQMLHRQSLATGRIIRSNVFLYHPTLSQNTSVTHRQTDGQTDRRQPYHRPLQLSCSASKMMIKM